MDSLEVWNANGCIVHDDFVAEASSLKEVKLICTTHVKKYFNDFADCQREVMEQYTGKKEFIEHTFEIKKIVSELEDVSEYEDLTDVQVNCYTDLI